MLKKLLIAAVAVVVGMAVVSRTSVGSLMHVWWKDAARCCERAVPPEVRIKQLQVEIDRIDQDIKKNLGRLAAQQVDCKVLEENVAGLREETGRLKDNVSAMAKAVDADVERVNFQGTSFSKPILTRRLDGAVNTLKLKKAELANKEKLLEGRKQTLEVAHQRISDMCAQREQLRVTVAQLETRVEMLKLQQQQAKVELDDSQVGRCNELVSQINRQLAQWEEESKLQQKYGFTNEPPAEKGARPTSEVLKDAREVLGDNGGQRVAGNK